MSLTDSYKQRLKQLNSNPSAQRSSSPGKSTGARSAKSSLTDSYKQRLAQLAASGQVTGPKPATFSELRQSSTDAFQAARKAREQAQKQRERAVAQQVGVPSFGELRSGSTKMLQNQRAGIQDLRAGKADNTGAQKDDAAEKFSLGKYAAGIVEKGVHQFAGGISSTLSMAEGMLTKPVDYLLTGGKETPLTDSGLFHKWNEDIQENIRQAEEKYEPNAKAGGKILEVADDFGTAVIAAIPQAAVAWMSSGAAAKTGLEVAKKVPGFMSSLRSAVASGSVSSPFLVSLLSTVGNEYDTAKEDGASEMAAYLYALSAGTMNAFVEVSGGIETLPTELQGSRFTVKKWIESMVDEGKEEVVQGIISRASQNLFYGKGNPLFSTADQDAVLNPMTAAQEFAGGAVVGGILGGAQGVAANILNGAAGRKVDAPVRGPATDADSQVQFGKYDSAVQKAVDKAQTVRYDRNVETAEATVLNRGATLYTQLGMGAQKAEAKAAVVQKLIDGRDVTTGELKSLNLSDAKYRAIFTELTGVVFPEGVKMSDDQRFNLARTAKDVAAAQTEVKKLLAAVLETAGDDAEAAVTADTTQSENAPQGVQEAAEAAELRDPDNGPADYEHFAQAYRETVKADAEDAEIRASYEGYLRDAETIRIKTGEVTRAEFRAMMRQTESGASLTDEQLNAFFDYVRENEDQGGAPMFNTEEVANGRGTEVDQGGAQADYKRALGDRLDTNSEGESNGQAQGEGKGVSDDTNRPNQSGDLEGTDPVAEGTGTERPGPDGTRAQSSAEGQGRGDVRNAGERVQGAPEAEGRVQGEGRELNKVPEGAAEASWPAEAPSSIAQRFHSWEGAYLYLEDQGLNLTFDVPPNEAALFGEIVVGYQDGKKWVTLGSYGLGADGLAQFKADFSGFLSKSDPGFTAANQISTVKKTIAGVEYEVLADPEKMGFEKAVKDAKRVGMTLAVVNDKHSFRKEDGSSVAGVASPDGYILTTRDPKSADHEVMHGYLYADHGFRNKLVRGMDTKGRQEVFKQAKSEVQRRWGQEYERKILDNAENSMLAEFEYNYALENEVLCEARAGSTSLGPMMKKLIPYVQKETAKWEAQWDATEHPNLRLKSNPNTEEIMAYFGMEPGDGEVDGYADFEAYALPENADPMYSYLLKTVLAYKGDKLGASSVVPYLRGRGVKAEEIKWSGLENFLEGKRSVTKDELAGFLHENALVVNTETLGGDANNGRPFVDRETGEVYEDFEGIMDEAARRAEEMGIDEEYLREDYSEDGEYYGVYAFLPQETRTIVKARMDTTTGKMVDEETGEVYSTSQELNDAAELRFAQMGLGSMEVDGLVFGDEDNPWPAFALRQDVQMPAQIRGPEDLKDLIITIEARRPSREVPLVNADREGRPGENGPRWGEYKTEGGENYREYKYTLPGATYTNDAMQVHWGQKGVLAHARVQDFRAADGKKTLLIEEIQSDWHNAGQKSGYATEDYDALMREQRQLREKRITDGWSPVDKRRYDEIGALLHPTQTKVNQEIKNWTNQLLEDEILSGILDKLTPDIIADNRRFGENIDNDTARQYAVNKLMNYSSVDDWMATDGLKVPLLTEEESARLDEFYTGLRNLYTRQTESMSEDREIRSRPPEAPFSKNYHEFVLKKLLREAAENGYEYLAWTTADMQSERWSNEYAEGYRIEYDQDIPKFLNKYGKQWGARVGLMELDNYDLNDRVQQRRIQRATEDLESWKQELELAENESQRDFILEQISYSEKELAQLQKKGDTVWYIPITQEMRNSVLYEGQPMFNMPSNTARGALAAKFDKVYGEGAAETLFAAADQAFSRASEEARLNPPAAPVSQADGEMTGWVTYGRSVGSAALRFDPYSYLQNEYGTIEQTGRNNARIVDVPKSTNGRDKVSKTTATVMGAKATPEGRLNEIASAVVDGKLSYYPTTNKIAENKARARIRKIGYKDALAEWTEAVDSGKVNSDLVAMGATLLNNAGNSGEVNGRSYTMLMAKYAQLLRSAGQALQAANIFQKMTPEAKLYTVVRQVEEINARHDTGLPVSMWMDQVGELLADEIYKRIDVKEPRERVKTVADTVLEDLTKYARELVARESVIGTGATRTEMERLQDMFNNRANYEEAWQVAKNRLVDEFGADANMYAALENWINTELTYADKLTKILTDQSEVVMPESLAEEYLAADTDEARDEVMDRILQSIADQIPATFMDKFTALRYTGMLGNLRTNARNVAGNAVMQPVVLVKNTFAGLAEALIQKAGVDIERTNSVLRDKETFKAAKADFENVREVIAGGGKYRDNRTNISQEIRNRQRIFKNAALEGMRKGTSWMLDNKYFGDAAFSSFTYADAMARYMAANGTTWSQASEELKDKARAVAIREAAEATYRDNNAFSEAITQMRFRNPKNNVQKGINLLAEGILPFRKTPANILVRSIEYSPIGLVTSMVQTARTAANKTDLTAADLINSFSKGLTGTGLLIAGMALASTGYLKGKGPEDEKEKALWEMQGHQEYSLEIDGTSYTVDWAAPVSIPLLVGAELHEALLSEGLTVREAASVASAVFDPILEMSMLQGVNDAISNAQTYGDESALVRFVGNALWSYISQPIPTLLGQAERASQNIRMTTYVDKNKDVPDAVQRALGKASAKIPGWDYAQVQYIDAWGRTQKNADSATWNVIEQFVSPGYANSIQETDMEKELIRLKQATGDASVLIKNAPKYFNVSNERKDLTADEYLVYAKTRGQTAFSVVTDITESKAYSGIDDKQKAAAVSKAYDYANQVAKEQVTNGAAAPDKWVSEAQLDAVEYGIPVSSYLIAYAKTKDLKGIQDKSGETVDDSKGLRVMAALYEMPGLTDDQVKRLAEDFDVGKTVRGYNANMVKSKLEAMERKYQ